MQLSEYFFFFFTDTATTDIYTLSLHDALPISKWVRFQERPASAVIRMTSSWPTATPCASSRKQTPVSSAWVDRKSTRLNSSHTVISYAVFCLKKKKIKNAKINTLQTS